MTKCQFSSESISIERGVNATDNRCEWWLPMTSWGRMPLLSIYTCPQEPWEAQE